MVFSSVLFLFYFLAPLLVLYFIVPLKMKNILLFLASLVFYAWGEPKYVFLMLLSALFNYISGLVIHKSPRKKLWMVINVVFNLGLLVFFKYTNFIISWADAFFSEGAPVLNIVLPIGISFYTFQALSYTIDVYRGKTEVQKSFLSFGLYLAMFPQLIAGPIVRYDDVAKQVENRTHAGEKFMEGFARFCAGLCKKVIIANSLGKLWSMVSVFDFSELSMSLAWLGLIAFAMQIYFDFSGYSDMAIGLGKMFGFDFLENFNYPYISRTITEFWRRWHMSLGSWFREYVYIPLGGNRVGKARAYFNILVVWMLTGLWHGAEWNFVIWGLYFALLLVIEKRYTKKFFEKHIVIGMIYTSFAVALSWAIFSITDMNSLLLFFKALFNFGNIGFDEINFLYNRGSFAVLFVIAFVVSWGVPKRVFELYFPEKGRRVVKYIAAILGFVVCVSYLVDDTFNPFLYFRF